MPAPPQRRPSSHRTLRLPHGRSLRLGSRPLVMGILNITPDSFSDGGLWLERDRAVSQGLQLLEEGADLLDLGAESTRPGGGVYGQGAQEVPAEEEIARLLPVLRELRQCTDRPLSVDTRKGPVAKAALDAGADLINDVSLLADETLAAAVAEAGSPLVLMHSRGEISEMQKSIHFEDLLGEVAAELEHAVSRAEAAGVERDQIVIDPGIGFGKSYEQNLRLIANADFFEHRLDLPVLLGASRKSFIGHLTAADGSPPDPPRQRLEGSLATVAWASITGAAMVRVHDVAETVRFLKVWYAIEEQEIRP